jgi:hypothetical protein
MCQWPKLPLGSSTEQRALFAFEPSLRKRSATSRQHKPFSVVTIDLPIGVKYQSRLPCYDAQDRGTISTGKASGRNGLTLSIVVSMTVKKRTAPKRPGIKQSTATIVQMSDAMRMAAANLLNMIAVMATSGSVLLCFFAVKRFV